MKIQFGTSGWRGIIADDFTFNNVRIASMAIAQYLLENNGNSILMGYDTRFLSEDFAKESAEVLAKNNIKVYFSAEDIPTPVLAYEIIKRQADGAINITASHNDYYYNGLKFSAKTGGPALPEETKRIEEKINSIINSDIKIEKMPFNESVDKKIIEIFNDSSYLNDIRKLIDFPVIEEQNLKIVYEPFFATGRKYLPRLLGSITDLKMIHGKRDPMFGNLHPEPIEKNLEELINEVKVNNSDIGLSTDGDADRFGVIDKGGVYFPPDKILSIIYYYLLTERKMKGNVVRTVATTQMLDRIAKHFGFEAIETPVGFKYIGDAVVKGEAIFGGEESGGGTIAGWLPEKDGILIDSLITEIISKRKLSLTSLFKEIVSIFGEIYSERIDFDYEGDRIENEKKLKSKVFEISKAEQTNKINEIDGTKMTFEDGSWLLFRFSGTENKIRAYYESSSSEKLRRLKEIATRTVESILRR
jgi:phosphoglucomutase